MDWITKMDIICFIIALVALLAFLIGYFVEKHHEKKN